MADTALDNLQSQLGWKLDYTPRLRIFPTLDTYRDATGQPGWIAAYTQGRTISLQPISVLQQRSALEDALRHELAHLLVEARARADTPLWFREGLVLYLTEGLSNSPPVRMAERQLEDCLQRPPSREALANCYAAARTRVSRMVQESGRETVLRWLSDGLPISGDRNGNPPQH
jgi:stage II sporulation protein D